LGSARGNLLDVSGLKVDFYTYRGVIKALNGVELWIDEGEKISVVGETGCGKSVTALSIMQLIDDPGRIVNGKILFKGKDLNTLKEPALNKIRGKDISMIFQEPISALNPTLRIGYQVAENLLRNHKWIKVKKVRGDLEKILRVVELDWERVTSLYPHELSGGMAQRAMIAIALSSNPQLLIADEPTSALDVTIQIQILDLLNDLVEKFDTAVLLITHDMGVAAFFSDKIAVMYAGNTIEFAKTSDIFKNPIHPYTQGLLKSVPKIGMSTELESIRGSVPDLVNPPPGCRFHPRCRYAMPVCKESLPILTPAGVEHYVACLLYDKERVDDATTSEQ
jgi:peptide/nickel transport system ATP-binding protein